MIVSRLQLYCSSKECKTFFPVEGPVDGALFSPGDLRREAKEYGWIRIEVMDFCPVCAIFTIQAAKLLRKTLKAQKAGRK